MGCGMNVGIGLCGVWDECGPRSMWGCGMDVDLVLCGGVGWMWD